ncbi:LOW QUALITY PROTEIN: hypothetical protein OSB04_030745 [Centaurea solstitialis]|uniref:Tf2-1-like SH3-like domain-containing protein n=1 Tax=Centaurea solstitialis TaxID=347529 RepID=A0AA38VTM1_9ASTR|nr:LOW QUALITY PROTEIN: hypothetical protein OSB04_030745 [Centaurea solstitialis]
MDVVKSYSVASEGVTKNRGDTLSEAWQVGLRFIRPFEIVARVGKVAYWSELPTEHSQIHNIFHASSDLSTWKETDSILEENKQDIEDREIGISNESIEGTQNGLGNPMMRCEGTTLSCSKHRRFRGRNLIKWGRVVTPRFLYSDLRFPGNARKGRRERFGEGAIEGSCGEIGVDIGLLSLSRKVSLAYEIRSRIAKFVVSEKLRDLARDLRSRG